MSNQVHDERQADIERIQSDYRVKLVWGAAKIAFGLSITMMINLSVSYLKQIVGSISSTADAVKLQQEQFQEFRRQSTENFRQYGITIQKYGSAIQSLTTRQDQTDRILNEHHLYDKRGHH